MLKKSSIYIFIKAQFSAFLGGAVDYGIMVLCTELLYIHYTISIVIGGVIGALINFTLNRNWTFNEREVTGENSEVLIQLLKFSSMVVGSVLLKSWGTFLLTEMGQIDYKVSRIVIDVLVSICFNYTLQRYWIFKKSVS
ncbi:GtrA family protein [Olivibacter sp. CPCC 100613]|uniref:GtrA family protein n=1 Tax=Olivibacter sp. CPCC 100613 TaxID=3079931 RepID=UPI002FFC12F0